MTRCPDPEEFVKLLDAQLDDERAAQLRTHTEECKTCGETWAALTLVANRLAAPPEGFDEDRALGTLLARIAHEPPAPAKKPVRRAWVALSAGLAAAAAIALVLARLPRDGTFQSRGGDVSSLAQGAAVRLSRLEGTRRTELRSGDRVPADAAFTGSYRLRGPGVGRLLMCAVDAAGTVHWLYPACLDPKTDPESLVLAPSASETVLATSVIMDAPHAGPMHVYALVTQAAHHVSEIERLPHDELTAPALARRFEDGTLEEWSIDVEAVP